MNRKQSSGRPRSVTTEENADLIKELICSQEDAPHTHLAPRKIADQTGISQMNDGYRIRRYDRATAKKVWKQLSNDRKNGVAGWKRFYACRSLRLFLLGPCLSLRYTKAEQERLSNLKK